LNCPGKVTDKPFPIYGSRHGSHFPEFAILHLELLRIVGRFEFVDFTEGHVVSKEQVAKVKVLVINAISLGKYPVA
jgi:hypothetical protein